MPEQTNKISLKAVLNKLELDSDGTWRVRFLVDGSQEDAIMAISRYNQKVLNLEVIPEDDKIVSDIS